MSDRWGYQPPPPPPRRGVNPRTAIWLIAGLALVVVLVRTHHLSTFAILLFCALIPSVILHEVSHGAVALAFGDDTARRAGRLTLNPIRHIDPFGTIILPALLVLSGLGAFGYAKPVPVNVSRLRHPRNESVVVSLVGPAVNVLLALVFGFAYRYAVPLSIKILPTLAAEPTWAQLLFVAGYVNVILAVFNLIPLPPLDGSAVVERLLPSRWLSGYYRIRPFTLFLPLVIVVFRPQILNDVFNPALNQWARVVGV
ncbi:MAG TPA: site-2 protease family protein [Acidimicrobiales bacterium]|nr:site-2 protease family protein [Acidimicrobiales bacterium]